MSARLRAAIACFDQTEAASLAAALQRRGCDVAAARDLWDLRSRLVPLETAAGSAHAEKIDVVVLGALADQADVLNFLHALPDEAAPSVLLVRPQASLLDIVLLLELGAADVVSGRALPREVVARVLQLLARRGRAAGEMVRLEHSTVDVRSALVMLDNGGEEQLSPGQVAMLRLFAANPQKVLSRDDLIASAPAGDDDAFDRSIDSRIVRLRRKLRTRAIVTIRGSGYRFDPPGR